MPLGAPRFLKPLAWLFAAATLLYAGVWLYTVRLQPQARLGVESRYSPRERRIKVHYVHDGSPADVAGLKVGDEIVAVDGQRLRGPNPVLDLVLSREPGDSIRLAVERAGRTPPDILELEIVLGEAGPQPLGRSIAIQLVSLYPVPFVVVGLAVLLLRPDDRNAWLLALVFAGFVAGAPVAALAHVPPLLRRFCLAYQIVFAGLSPAFMLFFFSVFPGRSSLDARAPWLKWLWLGAGAVVALPVAAVTVSAGSLAPLASYARSLRPVFPPTLLVYSLGGFTLGLASLLWNTFLSPDGDVRRKGRVVVWGTLLGLVPALALQVASLVLRRSPAALGFWFWAPAVIALSLLPLSYAYAVVKHRVLEVPVLLRRSARYLLVQRGAVGVLVGLALLVTLLVAQTVEIPLREEQDLGLGFTLGAGFGTLLAWGAARLHRRLRERIDRAFFRRTYDVHHLLQDLATRIRSAGSRGEVARLLEEQLSAAVLPRSLAVYLEGLDGRLHATATTEALELPDDLDPPEILAGRARSADRTEQDVLDAGVFEPFRPHEAECLVPLNGRDGRLIGLVVMGPRLSEEPYSGEDRRLLETVAGQAGIALEGIRLAEEMALRLESERRTDHELNLAAQVQRRLLPQAPPNLESLDCVGGCLQARAVGGDYYDFLDLGPGRVGLVLADISGKGFSAALLMASLQASLRSRSAQAGDSLAQQLKEINDLLHDASQTHHYATLFVGVYDDTTRQLHYANCGHNPPMLVRARGGEVERLAPTGMVIGLMKPWSCETAEVGMREGDTLVVFSDGATDALTDDGEDFGEARLLETLRTHIEKPVAELLGAVVDTVRRFSESEQEDDLTLLVARGR